MIRFRQQGDFSKTEDFLKRAKELRIRQLLESYGQKGVAALASATPVETGLTASSWFYEIVTSDSGMALVFKNSNIQNGVPIAIILHYGHGTRNGGWVEGRDYIFSTIQPIFDQLAKDAWREVTKL